MREALELKNEFYEKWVSPDGLALLGEGHKENDNGILFYAYFMILCKEFDLVNSRDKEHGNRLLEMLQEKPGLLNRRKDANQSLEAHDNYAGALYVALLHGNLDFCEKVVDYGVKNGWNYNNIPPYNWRKESQRQGGEVALYQVCAGYTPDIFYFIWLCIGLLISSCGWSSLVLLSWVRIKAMKLASKGKKHEIFVDVLSTIHELIVKSRGGRVKFIREYFGDSVYTRMGAAVYG